MGKWGSGEVGYMLCFALLCFALTCTRTRNEIRLAKAWKDINPTRHKPRDEKD